MNIIIRNGRIWDGDRFLAGDVAIDRGTIAQLGGSCEQTAPYEFDAKGMIVAPGLVDIHTHLRGISIDAFGAQAEMACLPFGVTAAVDAGGSKGDKARLDAFAVHTAVLPVVEIQNDAPDFSMAERLLPLYGERAIGVKAYYDDHMYGVATIRPLQQIVQWAGERGLMVMVHCNRSPVPMEQILQTLRPGDILTHIYHGGKNTAMDDGFAAMQEARRRGVMLDAGLAGHVHTDFEVLRQALAQGLTPDTISTDITCSSAYKRGGRYGLLMCMSLMRRMGMDEESVLRCVTGAAADAVRRPWGRLAVGGPADVAVLSWGQEGYSLTDGRGETLAGDHMYQCRLTVLDGQVVYRS